MLPVLCVQIEFILMGGTFMSLPTEYRDYFVRKCVESGLHKQAQNVHCQIKALA